MVRVNVSSWSMAVRNASILTIQLHAKTPHSVIHLEYLLLLLLIINPIELEHTLKQDGGLGYLPAGDALKQLNGV